MRFGYGMILVGVFSSPTSVHRTHIVKSHSHVCTIPTTGSHSSELPCPLTDLLANDGTLFYQWVTQKSPTSPLFADYGPAGERRRCEGTTPCLQKKKQTVVKIRATIDAYKVDIDHLPQNGLVVALLVQHRRYGKFQEYKYSLPAGPDTAYFVVEPGTPYNGINTGKWTLVTASSTFSGDISRGTFYRCDTDDDAPTASYATFGTCLSDHIAARKAFAVFRESQRAATDSLAAKALRAAIVSAGEYDDPAWLSCVHGCCIADQGAPQLQGRTSRKR